jgi:bacterioferritin B
MLITQEMIDALNVQIGNEFGSSLQYVAIAAHFDAEALPELAKYFFRQADEEHLHALKFVNYITDTGGRVEVPALPKPQHTFGTVEEAIRRAYDGELSVTRQINELVDLSVRQTDHLTHQFLQWFVTEQLEEVSSMDTLLKIVIRAEKTNLLHVEEYLSLNPRLTRLATAQTRNGN